MTAIIRFIQTHWFPITLFLLAAITISSLWPGDHLPEFPGSDKTHHLISYLCLMLPAVLANKNSWWKFMLLFFCVSGAIELIQPYVNRYGDWLDMMANGVGLIAGVLIGKMALKYINYKETKQNNL